jgi:hypothetical protein
MMKQTIVGLLLLERLAVLTPRPRVNLVLYCGGRSASTS